MPVVPIWTVDDVGKLIVDDVGMFTVLEVSDKATVPAILLKTSVWRTSDVPDKATDAVPAIFTVEDVGKFIVPEVMGKSFIETSTVLAMFCSPNDI